MTFFFETFPMPPSINDYYGRRPSGGVYIKKEGKEFREKVVAKVMDSYGDFPTFTEPVRVVVDRYPPDRRRRDADNILKALLDAIKHAGVYRDDCLVFELDRKSDV